MRRMILGAGFAAAVLACIQAQQAHAQVLITQSEAQLPASPDAPMTMRGLTRGPGIEQVSPSPDQRVRSPLPFKIRFLIRNKVAIDPASVKLTYLKAKPIDLTERIKKYLKPDGIDMQRAEVPPGTHVLRLDVKDQQGRSGTAIIKLTVAAN
jgi:hypothetical protein